MFGDPGLEERLCFQVAEVLMGGGGEFPRRFHYKREAPLSLGPQSWRVGPNRISKLNCSTLLFSQRTGCV